MSNKVIEKLLLTFNSIIIVFCILEILVGIYFYLMYSKSLGALYITYALIILVRSIIGIISVTRINLIYLFSYILLIPILWIMGLIVLITQVITFIQVDEAEETGIPKLRDIERRYSCCGLKGSSDYKKAPQYFSGSCCNLRDNLKPDEHNKCWAIAVTRKGCSDIFFTPMIVFTTLIMAFQILIWIFELACFVFSIIRYKNSRIQNGLPRHSTLRFSHLFK